MKNATLNNNTVAVITEVSNVIAMKALKTTYSHNAIQLFYPSPYNQIYSDLCSIATVAILETMNEEGITTIESLETMLSEEDYNEVVRRAYKAINAYIYSQRKEVNHRLYSLDEEGNMENTSYSIERMMVTFGDILKREMKPSELRIIKYLAMGYTNETIVKRMGYKNKRSADKAICKARKSAAAILTEYGYNVK